MQSPDYKVGDVLYSVRYKELFKVEEAKCLEWGSYMLIRLGTTCTLSFNTWELLYYQIRLANEVELLLYS